MQYRYSNQRGFLNEAAMAAAEMPLGPSGAGPTRLPTVSPKVTKLVPERLARELRVFPIKAEGETITLAAIDPNDIKVKDKLTFVLNRRIKLVGMPPEVILGLIDRHYGEEWESGTVDSMLQEFTDTAITYSGGPRPHALGGFAGAHHRARHGLVSRDLAPPADDDEETFDGDEAPPPPRHGPHGLDRTASLKGDNGVFTYVVE
ncbi:hypothetical protein BH23PLA1_BH23PLA1_08620 [soil metagenome]